MHLEHVHSTKSTNPNEPKLTLNIVLSMDVEENEK